MDDVKLRILIIIGLFFAITVLIVLTVNLIMTIYDIPDPPNFITIIVEISIGFFIAGLVYLITQKQQSKIESAVTKLETILEKQEKWQDSKRSTAYYEMHEQIFQMDYYIHEIESFSDSYEEKDEFEFLVREFDDAYKIFRRLSLENSMFFDNNTISRFERVNQNYDVYYSNLNIQNPDFKTSVTLLKMMVTELRKLVKESTDTIDANES